MREAIEELVRSAVDDAIAAGEIALTEPPDPAVERPRDPGHGDWATAVALRSAKEAGMPPRQLADIIAAHIAGSEPFWMKEIIGGEKVNRDRAAEFVTAGVGVGELKERLESAGRITTEVLSGLKASELDEDRKWQDKTVSVRWCILHVIDHTAQHLGHMQLTLQLWKARAA